MKPIGILSRARGLFSKTRTAVKERGFRYVIRAGTRRMLGRLADPIWRSYCYHRIFKSWRTFSFRGKRYHYFQHRYNTTWMNERAVEIPIVTEIIKSFHGRAILEVGNVLSHYTTVSHDILDKYEKAIGVINEDVISYRSSKKYDLIVSISTLEHVGWDEEPRDPSKISLAIENLKNLLAPSGEIVVTLPIGYNHVLDSLVWGRKIEFERIYCLKRVSDDNKWKEVDCRDIQNAKYGYPFFAANGLLVGVMKSEK